MMELKERLLFIRNGMETKRFHTTTTIFSDTVGHHSCGVAMFVHILTEGNASANLLLAALTHDTAEHVFGDIPAPAKKAVDTYKAVGDLEEKMLATFGLSFPLNSEERRILKIADILDGMWFCYKERSFGNLNMGEINSRYVEYLHSLKPYTDAEKELVEVMKDLWRGVNV